MACAGGEPPASPRPTPIRVTSRTTNAEIVNVPMWMGLARPQSAVNPLQTASEITITPLRLVESAIRATGMPAVQ